MMTYTPPDKIEIYAAGASMKTCRTCNQTKPADAYRKGGAQ